MAAIEIIELKKYFGEQKAVDGISMNFDGGEVVGFIGPNGAGKTTTIGCMLGLLKPTAGEVRVNGVSTWGNVINNRSELGYIPADPYFYPNWTGQEYFNFLSKLNGVAVNLKQLIDRFAFNPKANIKTLSTGNKQKLSIIIALMYSPKILIMDEPTRGLDPLLQNTFYECLKELKDIGATIFMSSHNLTEVESICSKVALIKQGKLIEFGDLKSVQTKRLHTIKLTLKNLKRDFEEKLAKLGVQVVNKFDHSLELKITGDLSPMLKLIAAEEVVDLSINRASLEELFLEFYK